MRQFKNVVPWVHKLAMRSLLVAGSTILLAPLALVPMANAQVVIGVGIQPVCSYGYYNYAPYGCAPSGFYGPGYFYNGIFLGVGPWANWGYGHGWGEHRFSGGGGGRYVGVRGNGGRAYAANRGGHPSAVHSNGGAHVAAAHGNGGAHAAAAHGGASHGGESHGGGEHH
jgi:hypothetical protein